MASIEPYVQGVKPAIDAFVSSPTKENISSLKKELSKFEMMEMILFDANIVMPLVFTLGEMDAHQDLQTGTVDCIRLVVSKQYLMNVAKMKTILVVVIKTLREPGTGKPKNVSEELKLSAVLCITEIFQRATTDVLEQLYTSDSLSLLGLILMTLVEFIEKEKYRKLIVSSLHCLMSVFYVSDKADSTDVVLRNQIAETLFAYLPKVMIVLTQTCVGDEILGETLKSVAICALGRILRIMYARTNVSPIIPNYDKDKFRKLWSAACRTDSNMDNEDSDEDIIRNCWERNERTPQWFVVSRKKLHIIFQKISYLRSHSSARIRLELARMCCNLIQHCALDLDKNFVFLLENVITMSEDKEDNIRKLCRQQLHQLQQGYWKDARIFDETADVLLDVHLAKLPRIIKRSNDSEQCCELMFFCGFLRNLSECKLTALLSIPRNKKLFCMCLISAIELNMSHDLLNEEYSLRQINEVTEYSEYDKLPWRRFKNINNSFGVHIIQDICGILGRVNMLSYMLFDFLNELLCKQNQLMNEIILLMLWMVTPESSSDTDVSCEDLRKKLLVELLKDHHWQLVLKPDREWRLKVDKPSNWFMDRTPGLYESAVEVRTQDCDSDDENDMDNADRQHRVTIADAQFNALHTCIVLDALAHCAKCRSTNFNNYIYICLHKVLLKFATSNALVHQAASFALISIQQSLQYECISYLIEDNMDYIASHLNRILKETPESKSAADMLTVVLQFSTQKSFPSLAHMFQTIRNECAKTSQAENINAYLKVFCAFLTHLNQWKQTYAIEQQIMPMDEEDEESEQLDEEFLNNWLNVLNRQTPTDADMNLDTIDEMKKHDEQPSTETINDNSDEELNPKLPYHIEMSKDIINQVLKFLSSSEKMHQILALECLNVGIPLLSDYENVLLPLVHLIWQPFLEKFRQNDAIVLNRCFTLLSTLATHAKEFILKRSLDDVIPFLKRFLEEAASHSAVEKLTTKTQEYKLQIILLKNFANLIQSMQIDGKHLNEIAEVISLYLSEDQPEELQQLALQFNNCLRKYDGPLVYLVVKKLSYLKRYEKNFGKIVAQFQDDQKGPIELGIK